MNSVTVDNFSFNGRGPADPLLVQASSIDFQTSTPDGCQSSTPSSTTLSAASHSPPSASSSESSLHHSSAALQSPPDPTVGTVTVTVNVPADLTYSRAEGMKSLNESIAHKEKLKHLKESEKEHQKTCTGWKKSVRRQSKSMYVVLGWYFLLQSAIFATAAQTSIFTCRDWWGPVGIAGIVSIGTFISVVDKLRRIGDAQQEVKFSQTRQNAVWDQIQKLNLYGATCNLDAMEPHHELVRDPNCGFRYCLFSPHGYLSLSFLVCFSCLIVLSCINVLCSPCKCSG